MGPLLTIHRPVCTIVGHVDNAGKVERQPPQVLWLDYAINSVCPLIRQSRHILLHPNSPRQMLVPRVTPGKSLRVFRQTQEVCDQTSLDQ